jgi:lactoylglutathione lyase
MTPEPNVEQGVPFLWVKNLEASLPFYVEGLGFIMTKKWIDDGKLQWCWLELGGAALMLQQYRPNKIPPGKLGVWVTILSDPVGYTLDFESPPTPRRRQIYKPSPS